MNLDIGFHHASWMVECAQLMDTNRSPEQYLQHGTGHCCTLAHGYLVILVPWVRASLGSKHQELGSRRSNAPQHL